MLHQGNATLLVCDHVLGSAVLAGRTLQGHIDTLSQFRLKAWSLRGRLKGDCIDPITDSKETSPEAV